MTTTTKGPQTGSGVLPFGKDFPVDQVFEYNQLHELKQITQLAIAEKSPVFVSGEAGVGKTTAIRIAISLLPTNKYSVIYLGQDQDGANLLRRLCGGLGLKPKSFRVHALMQISQFLSDNMVEQGKTPVVVIDEAHLLDDATLEDLRLLTNADFDRSCPLALILLGQLPLRGRLKSPNFEAFNQRLRFRYSLEGFSEEETMAYIQHRLSIVDESPDLFTADAGKQIFLASRGILREINNLALAAFLKARATGVSKIDGKLVRQVLDQRELN